MRASPMLIAAMSLNVVLAAALLISHYPGFRGSDATTPAGSSGAPTEGDPAKLVAWAKRHGASEQLAHRLALAVSRPIAATVLDEYWKPAPERAAALREAEYKSLQETRQLLLQSFGPAAKEQPAFADIFQPYRARLPFLSADKQMALQQILFETDNAGPAFVRSGPGASDPRSTRIRALLSEEEFAEYERRESPTAMRLANNGFDFTEQEFRAVYDVMAAAGQQQSVGPQPLLLAAMPAIERELGAARFQEFQRAQDPLYRWLQAGAKRFGVTHETVVAAYGVIKDTQKRAAGVGPGVAAAETRAEMFAARDRELTARLGEQMFAYISPRLESSGGPRSGWPGDPASAFLPVR